MIFGTGLVGYAAALEQFPPREALELCDLAERCGFSGVMAADHFQPWVPAQGEASFVWSFLGSVAERTTGDLGPGVVCPSFRTHPAVVAQAAASLESCYPGRAWLGLGSGEALNESFLAQYWPGAGGRVERLFEAIEVITGLFARSSAGRDYRHAGKHFTMEPMRLWTMPEDAPPILVAAGGPVTARKTGQYADGMITVGAPVDKLDMLTAAFETGARAAGKDPAMMPRLIQVHLSWAETMEEAQENALHQWPNGGMGFPKADIRSPFDFEQMARLVRLENYTGRMVVSEDPDVHRSAIQNYLDLGFDKVYLHNVGRNQREWLKIFARDVLPGLHR